MNRKNIERVIRILKGERKLFLFGTKNITDQFGMCKTLHISRDNTVSYCIGGICYRFNACLTWRLSKGKKGVYLCNTTQAIKAVTDHFEISYKDDEEIVIPYSDEVGITDIGNNAEWAVRMLEKLKNTGVVDWEGTRYAIKPTTTTEEKETSMYIDNFITANLQMTDEQNGRTFPLTVEAVIDATTAVVSYQYGAGGKKYSFTIDKYGTVIASSSRGLRDFRVSFVTVERFTVKRVSVNSNGVVATHEVVYNVDKDAARRWLDRDKKGDMFAVDLETKKVYVKGTL